MMREKCKVEAQSGGNTGMHQRTKNAVFLQNQAQYFKRAQVLKLLYLCIIIV